MNAVSATNTLVSRIPLEKPASIRRQFPMFDEQGWMLSEYIYGQENAGLQLLFDQESLKLLDSLSPVVFYGEQSTGKTALAITLAVCWARSVSLRPLCFATGKSFADDFAAAVEIDDLASFRSRYRLCKLLVIDNLEPIAAKPAAQFELIHTIDHLAAANAPVVITSAKLPAAVSRIEPSLASRLSAGYSTCLCKPGQQAIAAIIDQLVVSIDDHLSGSELAQFCSLLSKPLNALQLKTIVTIAHQNRSADGYIDYALLSRLVHQYLDGQGLSIAAIAKSVAKNMRVKLSDMRGATRQANIVRARGLAILLSRRLTPASLQQIGLFFGGRDHSTILHACRKTLSAIEQDAELSKVASAVQAELLN